MKHAWNVVLAVVSLIFLYPAYGIAASVLVSWNANTESNLDGYIIYYGTQSGVYSAAVDVGDVTSYQFNNVGTGRTYYIAVTAYDTSGNESDYSNEVSAYVPAQQTTPTISLLSPQNGTVLSTAPTLTWKGSGLARYKVLVSKDGRNYYSIYTGTGTSCTFPLSWWRYQIASGGTVYWYVEGTTSGGQVYKSSRYYFKKR